MLQHSRYWWGDTPGGIGMHVRYGPASTEQVLGALPVVAAVCRRLDIAGIVDRAAPVRDIAHATHGQVIAAMTCPCVAWAMSRTGAARSTMPAMSSRRHTAATTGNAPSTCSVLAGPYRTCIPIPPGVSPHQYLECCNIQDRSGHAGRG